MPFGDLGVASGRLDRRMAQQPLNRANVRAGFEQMGGKSVPQAVGGDALGEAGTDDDRVQDTLDGARNAP